MSTQNKELGKSETVTSAEQLRQGCHFCLDQCAQLLASLDSEHYCHSGQTSSIGAHVRHVLERFQSFLNGLCDREIDYDFRKRDRTLENNLQSAEFALATVMRRIDALNLNELTEQNLLVRESVHPQLEPVAVSSTIERELVSLISHSIHHLAIIAMLARPLGYQLANDFGKAASTIIHEQG